MKEETDTPESMEDKIVENMPGEITGEDIEAMKDVAQDQDIPINPVTVEHFVGDEVVIIGEHVDHIEEGKVSSSSAKKEDECQVFEEKCCDENGFIKDEEIKGLQTRKY